MSDHHEPQDDLNLLEEMGYEHRDVDAKQLTRYVSWFLFYATIAMFAGLGFMFVFAKDMTFRIPPEKVQERVRKPEDPAPLLQSNMTKLQDQRDFIKSQRLAITTYAWTDRKTGHVRIPIEEGVKKVLAKGLPQRANPHPPEDEE